MDLVQISEEINIPTKKLTSELIQAILIKTKQNNAIEECDGIWKQIADTLWTHLQSQFKTLDDQLLCAICFYSVLIITEQDVYLNKVADVLRKKLNLIENYTKDDHLTSQAMSLMYGLFQSSYLTKTKGKDLHHVLESSFELLTCMAYEYSQYTFLVFKIMNSFGKVNNTPYQHCIINYENEMKLLNLVNHNWENPISGVRDLNRGIFKIIISIMQRNMHENVIKEIDTFYWNKAKYLMLSEIIEEYNDSINGLLQKYDWIKGLLHSLQKPGLVSAGSDMYYAILKKLRSEDHWCELFEDDILNILQSTHNKSIENFSNYWCLPTLKKYPALLNMIIYKLEQVDNVDKVLYSSLCILKQGNRLGLVTKNWECIDKYKFTENIILRGIEHSNNYIRMLSFDILCVSNCKYLPTKTESALVIGFLRNNVNSDCTVLRQNMINSLSLFLQRSHMVYLNNLKNNEGKQINYYSGFCKTLQEFIITSLNSNGNYQRKITSIKLCYTFLSCVTETGKKKRNQARQTTTKLISSLRNSGNWILSDESFMVKLVSLMKDPAEDVREMVTQVLLKFYETELKETSMLNLLIDNALTSIKSKFFYEINCGQSLFKLISNIILLQTDNMATFSNTENIFNFAYNELISEYNKQLNVIQSIESGKQLHSFMSVLCVVSEVCLHNSHKLEVTNEQLIVLINTLEGISTQFIWEENSTSSDFSKMSEMIQNMISNSGSIASNTEDDAKISGLHQIVLNCLWLNVKGCCDLATILIQFEQSDAIVSKKCLDIITNVLETSRHKGAIESAGAALGKAIQHLSSQPEESHLFSLPFDLLHSKLQQLISEAGKMSSVTRRGAGLSIMVHRIVCSDMNKGKPLFHYFMKIILKACTTTADFPSVLNESPNIDNERDLPKAIYLHFLTRIVMDSALASDIMYYSASLAEIAFYNLTSSYWQIRNAALQLYGALIPKLIGQKKASGNEEETIATVACDEFKMHSPKLWTYIIDQLKDERSSDKLQNHSNLIPILNILANSAKRYIFSYDLAMQKDSDKQLLQSLMLLLGSPIYTVRRLVAKCIFNIFTFEDIYQILMEQDFGSENFVHGSLMLIMQFYMYYYINTRHVEKFACIQDKLHVIFTDRVHSYICRQLYNYMFRDYHYGSITDLEKIIIEEKINKHLPGAGEWAEKQIELYIQHVPWNKIPEAVAVVLGCSNSEYYFKVLSIRLVNDKEIPKEVLLQLVDILLGFDNKFLSSLIWKVMYQISLIIDLKNHKQISEVIPHIQTVTITYKLRYLLPFSVLAFNNSHDILKKISYIIFSFCDFKNVDIDMRYIAAMSNNELSKLFKTCPSDVKLDIIKSAVILLQDEDEEVRNLSAISFSNIMGTKVILQPYICLHKIFNREFLYTILDDPENGIKELCNDLSQIVINEKKNMDDYNPFANDSKNIYLEVELFGQLLDNLNDSSW